MGGGGIMLAIDMLLRRELKIPKYADSSGNLRASKVYRLAKVILSQLNIEGYLVMDPKISNQEMWHSANGSVKALKEADVYVLGKPQDLAPIAIKLLRRQVKK